MWATLQSLEFDTGIELQSPTNILCTCVFLWNIEGKIWVVVSPQPKPCHNAMDGYQHHTLLGPTPEIITQKVWVGAWEFIFLRSSQVMLMLLVLESCFEKTVLILSLKHPNCGQNRDKATKLLKCLRRKEENSKEWQQLINEYHPWRMTVSYLQTWENGKRGKCRRFKTMNNVRNSQKSMTGAMSKQTHQVGLIIQFASHKEHWGEG